MAEATSHRRGVWRWAWSRLVDRAVLALDVARPPVWRRWVLPGLAWWCVVTNAALPVVSVVLVGSPGPMVGNAVLAVVFGALLGHATVRRWRRDRRARRQEPVDG